MTESDHPVTRAERRLRNLSNMNNQNPPDAVDTRTIYRVYGWLMLAGGFIVLAWGSMWFGTDFPGLHFGKAALVRVCGALMMGAGCLAMAAAGPPDAESRRRGLLWFAAGHGIVLAMVWMQLHEVLGIDPFSQLPAAPFFGVLIGMAIVFVVLFNSANGVPFYRYGASTTGLLGRAERGPDALRSEYERQIREAASQEERHRLARDLHDAVKQQIFAMHTSAAAAALRFDEDREGARTAIEQVRRSAREAMTEMDAMLDQLRAAPLESGGLVEALRKLCEAVGFRTSAHVELKAATLPPDRTLPPGALQAAFRVAQEALSNVSRHARARNVRVALGADEQGALTLRVEDDGAGFDGETSRAGLGLESMRQRAASLGGSVTVESKPGEGTSVFLVVPSALPTREDYAAYRRRTLLYGGLLLAQVTAALFFRHHSEAIWLTLVASAPIAVYFLQQAVAILRLRRQMEAAR